MTIKNIETMKRQYDQVEQEQECVHVFHPHWYNSIKECRKTLSYKDVLIAVDVTEDGRKNFAAFPSHETVLQYSDMIHPQQRMLYEWISPATPTKLCIKYYRKCISSGNSHQYSCKQNS